jgi:putative oxidoreductase
MLRLISADTNLENVLHSAGLFALRVGTGMMILLGHGIPKLLSISSKWTVFPNPLGLGSQASLLLAIFAEVVCSIALIVGWKVRWAAIPLLITVGVAALIVNAGQSWADQELPLMYAIPFFSLILLGGGRRE